MLSQGYFFKIALGIMLEPLVQSAGKARAVQVRSRYKKSTKTWKLAV